MPAASRDAPRPSGGAYYVLGSCPVTRPRAGYAVGKPAAAPYRDENHAIWRRGMLALIRTLARLTSWLGAKVGANVAGRPSAPGHIQL
jgi:hypothetical protein